MNIRNKLKKYIVISVLLAVICLTVGFILYGQSGKLRVVKLDYEEKASLRYRVHLNNNNYYNAEYLEEGMQYISGLIKDIELTYNYNMIYGEKVNSRLISSINADIKIVDVTNNEKVIYEKNEELKSDKQEKKDVDRLTIDRSYTIDYQKYNDFANEFKSKYGIPADCKLIVTFTTSQTSSNEKVDNINRSNSLVIEIPLSEQMITIKKSSDTNEKSSYLTTSSNTFSNQLLFIVSLVLFFLSAGFVALAIYFYFKKTRLTSEYDRNIEKILKQYDAYITESTNIVELSPNTVFVKSFKELLDVRNNVEKAIIYNKVSDFKSRFIIVDEKQTYCYEARKNEE